MTMQYDDSNRGALFKNDKKTSDNHPDYKGQANVNGSDCWVSAWIKTDKTGKKYMSLSFQAKEAKQESPKPRTGGGSRPTRDEFVDDAPF